jgi:hypothetical protein
MERKAPTLVFEIKKHEDRRGHPLFTFCQPPRGVDVTHLSTEFNKQRAKITWKMHDSFLALQYACQSGLIVGAHSFGDTKKLHNFPKK